MRSPGFAVGIGGAVPRVSDRILRRHFLRVNAPRRLALIHGLFLALVVVNLVAGFQILGTLMSVG